MNSKFFKAKPEAVAQGGTNARPGDYEIGSQESRAAARALLDSRIASHRTFRILVSKIGRPLNLENTRCIRTLWMNGDIGEIVEFDGCDADLTEAQAGRLDQLIRMVPVDGKSYTLAEVGSL